MRIHYTVWTLISLIGYFCAPSASGMPAEVILLRHAEKPVDWNSVHLSQKGQERARALARYVTSTPALTNSGLPRVLFAVAWTRHSHRRTFETLEPLAEQLHRPIEQPFPAEDYAKLARHILTSPECDGQVVVVCWIHDSLPELAQALGVRRKPPPWKRDVFDRVWVITWPHGRAKLEDLAQHLLPGDTAR